MEAAEEQECKPQVEAAAVVPPSDHTRSWERRRGGPGLFLRPSRGDPGRGALNGPRLNPPAAVWSHRSLAWRDGSRSQGQQGKFPPAVRFCPGELLVFTRLVAALGLEWVVRFGILPKAFPSQNLHEFSWCSSLFRFTIPSLASSLKWPFGEDLPSAERWGALPTRV